MSTATKTSSAQILPTAAEAHRDWPAALAGILAVAAALGVSELLAGLLPGATSLVAAVGQVVIDLQPPGAKDLVVSLFGTNDKLALEVFIVVVALLIGAGLGLLARRRYGIAAIIFVVFGVVGFVASLGDPLAEASTIAAATALSVGVGLWVLGMLLDRSRSAVDTSDTDAPAAVMPDWSRRSFLIRSSAVGVKIDDDGAIRPTRSATVRRSPRRQSPCRRSPPRPTSRPRWVA